MNTGAVVALAAFGVMVLVTIIVVVAVVGSVSYVESRPDE